MEKMKGLLVDDNLSEFQELARVATRSALEGFLIPEAFSEKLTLGTQFDGDNVIFELYVPGERPADAVVISSACVSRSTKQVQVEVFNLERIQPQNGDLAKP